MLRPHFNALWAAFPDHVAFPTLEALYRMLGGEAAANINAEGFGPKGNTCASRLSVAFNKAGAPINHAAAKAVRAETLRVADGSLIIFRVRQFREYLLHAYGRPTLDRTTPFNNDFKAAAALLRLV